MGERTRNSCGGSAAGPSRDEGARRLLRITQGRVEASGEHQFPNNRVATAKYSKFTFVPLVLKEQFSKFANVYFLLISVVQYLGEKTTLFVGTIKAFSTIGLLCMIVSVSAFMSFLDDKNRSKADLEMNERETERMENKHQEVENVEWQDVEVGDILLVRAGEEICADMVVLYSSGDLGTAFVSTANLDGETNLKNKSAVGSTQALLSNSDGDDVVKRLKKLTGQLEAEAPCDLIHNFEGSFAINGTTDALNIEHVLLRGTMLKNTKFVIGLVIYTGTQTRMVMNSKPAPLKRARIEETTNQSMIVVLVFQAFLALFSDLIFLSQKSSIFGYWYLHEPNLILPDWLAYWITFFVLYSNLMPISLYPSMEICNTLQSYFIRNDRDMYWVGDPANEYQAAVRSSNLCQELGQVSYIFSDKTGTLTQNVMELKRIFVVGHPHPIGTLDAERGFNGAKTVEQQLSRGDDRVRDFVEILAVANTVMVTKKPDGSRKYEAESPDEEALVDGCSEMGWTLRSRERQTLTVDCPKGQAAQYTVHAVNAFNSDRKRQSVVVEAAGRYLLLVKGADNVMLARGNMSKMEQDDLTRHIDAFGRQGLRTLVLARKELSLQEFQNFVSRYQAAKNSIGDREKRLAEAAEDIESNLIIVGVTAIEDKLQDGVPDTIVKIREAGIKLWVLTGDKLETAREIGFSAKVLTNEMIIFTLEEGTLAEAMATMAKTIEEDVTDIFSHLEVPWTKVWQDPSVTDVELKQFTSKYAIMITGKALQSIQAKGADKRKLLNCSFYCSVLLACRVSPLQKSEMVDLVRSNVVPEPVTLAIGDGANDVPMIQTAQVGVGIAGREGRQAVNNSDFSVGQFAYLSRLLLVHGRWNYRRICKLTLFTFWRNSVQVVMICAYTFVSGFSGTCLFEDFVRLTFNAICSLPIVATGIFDKDVKASTALAHPYLYEVGRRGYDLTPWRMLYTIFSACSHGVILLVILVVVFPAMDVNHAGDYYTFGTASYTCLILDCTYRVLHLNLTHNKYTIGCIVVSSVGYILFLLAYPMNPILTKILAPNMYQVPKYMVMHLSFWLAILVIPACAMGFDLIVGYLWDSMNAYNQCVTEMKRQEEDYSASREADCERQPLTEVTKGGSDKADNFEKYKKLSRKKNLDSSPFGQQNLQECTAIGYINDGSASEIKIKQRVCIFVIGFFVAVTGGLALYDSQSQKQVRVVYEGPDHSSQWLPLQPVGTRPEEVIDVRKLCAPADVSNLEAQPCVVDIELPEAIPGEVRVLYTISPFFQNFHGYMKSEVPKELAGEVVTEAEREERCVAEKTRKIGGEDIVPCGLKATTVFNDSFTLENADGHGLPIDNTNIAWTSDVERYKNPVDYGNRTSTSWLYERYPSDVITQAEGVDSEHFATWMRPSALNRVWNVYGQISQGIPKQRLQLSIHNRYPTKEMGVTKAVVLTSIGMLGARHSCLGYTLIIIGALFMIIALILDCLQVCLQGALIRLNCIDSMEETADISSEEGSEP